MERIVRITWDEPQDINWLCNGNIKVALSEHCKNTKFEVEDLSILDYRKLKILKIKNNMKRDKIYKQIELICKEQHIMEDHYGVDTFNTTEPYFTTSQECDIKEMISDGVHICEIISTIKKW